MSNAPSSFVQPDINRTNTTRPDAAALYHDCRSSNPATQRTAYSALWQILYPAAFQLVHDQADASDLAQDCAQQALLRIYQRLHECHEAAAFLAWAQRIVSNLTIDELRRRKRFSAPPDEDDANFNQIAQQVEQLEQRVIAQLSLDEVRSLLAQAPISERSRRVVSGRFFDEIDDEQLAQVESQLSHESVLSSHVQVTRAKNLTKLRTWEPLREYLRTRS